MTATPRTTPDLIAQMQAEIDRLQAANDQLQVEFKIRSDYLNEVTIQMAENMRSMNALQTALDQMGVPRGE